MKTLCRVAAMLAICGTFIGCGGPSYPKTIPISGTVTFDGKPVDGATVTFIPTEGKIQPATGRTDAQGKYSLTTFRSGDGAQPGAYQVTVTKYFSEAGASPYNSPPVEAAPDTPAEPPKTLEQEYAAYEKAYKDAPKGPGKQARSAPKNGNELPKKYASQTTSGLAFTVSDANKTFDLKLDK